MYTLFCCIQLIFRMYGALLGLECSQDEELIKLGEKLAASYYKKYYAHDNMPKHSINEVILISVCTACDVRDVA